jgi:hypothetical protein
MDDSLEASDNLPDLSSLQQKIPAVTKTIAIALNLLYYPLPVTCCTLILLRASASDIFRTHARNQEPPNDSAEIQEP